MTERKGSSTTQENEKLKGIKAVRRQDFWNH